MSPKSSQIALPLDWSAGGANDGPLRGKAGEAQVTQAPTLPGETPWLVAYAPLSWLFQCGLMAGIAWWRIGGYGTAGPGFYIDPGQEPLRFLQEMPFRAPAYLAGWFFVPSADVFGLLICIGAQFRI